MIIVKRKIKFILFAFAFIIIAPIIVLYANGDSLANGWNLLATGGVYVTHMPVGSQVYLNGKLEGTTGFFSRSVLVKGLRPGTYKVSVTKDGYNAWKETVKVSGNLVSEADVFILQNPVILNPISKYLSKTVGTTTVPTKNKNPEYATISSLFAAATTTVTTQASGTVVIAKNKLGTKAFPAGSGDLSLWQDNGHVFISWSGDTDGAPEYMCNGSTCQQTIEAVYLGTPAEHIDFFPGYNDVILVTSGKTIFAVQAENNLDKENQIIYEGTDPDFLILNGSVYIKDGTVISKVSL